MAENRRTCLPSPARRILANTTQVMVRGRNLSGTSERPGRTQPRIGWPKRANSSGKLPGVGEFRGVELEDVVLTSERLELRPWAAADADRVAEVMRDQAMHDFLALPNPYTAADAERY